MFSNSKEVSTSLSSNDGALIPSSASASSSQGSAYTPVCRFYAQGLWCRYGRNCRFRHTRPITQPKYNTNVPPRFQRYQIREPINSNITSEQEKVTSQIKQLELGENGDSSANTPGRGPTLPPPISVDTKNEEPQNAGVQTAGTSKTNAAQSGNRKIYEQRAVYKLDVALSQLNDEGLLRLRNTEIEQLNKRFRGDKLLERDDGREGYSKYLVLFTATDPDWPYDVKDFYLDVRFPPDYPKQMCEISVHSDDKMPDILVRYMSKEIKSWLQHCHMENMERDRAELMFRPFLKWFDRNVEDFFTEGLKMYQKQLVAAQAGLEFVPYASAEDEGGDEEKHGCDGEEKGEVRVEGVREGAVIKGKQSSEERYEPSRVEGAASTGAVSNTSGEDSSSSDNRGQSSPGSSNMIPGASARRGTEIKFRGMRLSESVASVSCRQLSLMLSCCRCRGESDVLSVSSVRHVATSCSKCHQRVALVYRPILMHHYNNILGYLDLQGAQPHDIILMDCHFTVTCLNCGKDTPCEGLQHGVDKCLWCRGCHDKLSLKLESPRYTVLQVKSDIVINKGSNVVEVIQSKQVKRVKDAAIQEGRPLPDNGICKHYKKSYRWLRFPCCGKAYPCDVCHDDKEEHAMDWATRMICGYCAKEQPFSSSKPCISCNLSVTASRTAHWEGGKGCRNKTSMSRNDKQKYANTNKTTSNKKVGAASGGQKKKK